MLICVKILFLYSFSRSLSFARKRRTFGSLLFFLLQSSKKRHRCRLGDFLEGSTSLVRSHTPPPYVRTVHCSIGNSILPFELLRILKDVPPAARPPPRPASSYFSSSPQSRFPSLRILWLGRGGRRILVSASASCSSPSPHGPIREKRKGGDVMVVWEWGGETVDFYCRLVTATSLRREGGGPKFGWGEREGSVDRGSHP